ncbi:hypothetical protein niasHS_006116 [Heterodera schachtii]|uniref:MATH domain-containing protein n=1 Tax=Heterodera schachtii TaxID=97005 RepID=A0ABD2JW03_HETSC
MKNSKKYDIKRLVNQCLQIPIDVLADVFFAAEAFRLFDLEGCYHWYYYPGVSSTSHIYTKMHLVNKIKSFNQPKCNVLTRDEVLAVYQFHCHPIVDVKGQESLPFATAERSVNWNIPRENGGTLALEIEYFSLVAAESSWRRWSHPTMLIKGLPWKTLAEISQDKRGEKWLGLYLQFATENLRASWCCKCSKTLRILSHSNEDDYMKDYNHVFNNENLYYGWEHFIQITELMDPTQGVNDIGN